MIHRHETDCGCDISDECARGVLEDLRFAAIGGDGEWTVSFSLPIPKKLDVDDYALASIDAMIRRMQKLRKRVEQLQRDAARQGR